MEELWGRTVRAWVKHVRHDLSQEEDLYSCGMMGLLTALKRFDPQEGVPFLGFARPHVLGEMREYLRRDHLAPISRRRRAAGEAPPVVLLFSALETEESEDYPGDRLDAVLNGRGPDLYGLVGHYETPAQRGDFAALVGEEGLYKTVVQMVGDRDAAIVWQRTQEGLPFEAIANGLNSNAHTVRSAYRRACKRLQERWATAS